MAEALKNYYDKPYMTRLAKAVHKEYGAFHKASFFKLIFDEQWEARALKDRMHHIAICLHETLPSNYKRSIKILRSVLPQVAGYSEMDGFLNMCFPDYVEMYGLDDWEVSIKALEDFTKYASSEFAVRPFIIEDTKRMMAQMVVWSKDENHHVRRLASEGCRPRLPWAMALPLFKQNPKMILPILRNLKNDDQEYVRRSVANNLNDIAKDNPDVVIDIARKWHGKSKTTDRLVKHACRTLLKTANPDALAIFGFTDVDNITVKRLKIIQTHLNIGDHLAFLCEVKVNQAGKLRFEYGIDYMKANGKTSRKIFQIKEGMYAAGVLSFNKKHALKQMSTRKHYAGKHQLALIVNGVEVAVKPFFLKL